MEKEIIRRHAACEDVTEETNIEVTAIAPTRTNTYAYITNVMLMGHGEY
ncbi:hypothetical protein RZO55_25350 [Clostridium boliviensis]|uniref:D-ribose pyranase n=1 Tax=Clostridium boliviensis TaxID=318465 RepID=A0ABU4GTJ1_9CLOT|nr:hypothetical protein [Clostridium boliviensis]MDW2800899.1 hypothetical protein [Clostridium boliviensis]